MFRMRFWPITARPIRAISAVCSMNFVFNTLQGRDQNRVRISGRRCTSHDRLVKSGSIAGLATTNLIPPAPVRPAIELLQCGTLRGGDVFGRNGEDTPTVFLVPPAFAILPSV